ncbi:putative transketolase [Actinoplanes missouriensis 431]|uniref:Pyruvate dehydrogenase E1 component n=1 Tax=Actinoplanes missouriensis (strain ATCC 14538 / DSM 43046 / CBS 188.64 / JCM 3121 / NBRC 102363 / NCIMB 12654 / NRRL B-3342 / UNCC 431) TaxID=512565 RepID=I0H945_ACTM4|nr:1-deoxy-D-xylulose-5-phosphate synthase N-terminal domain-containing protein [Actinoplanes missouriensis]BAL89532.1 putative transketolase [Actinoplanes missouriensis 431]
MSDRIDIGVLREIARRVLWLSASIVDAANAGRPNDSGVKVGGHQASSASMVDIMVALWFAELTADDRVSVKPHASPVLHAINYLLGDLDESYLPRLRDKGGLQSYPSRLKDPDTVDFSTGSVGIGATAALWAAMAHRYLASRFPGTRTGGRFVSLLGDAELDEGAIWEAVMDPAVAKMGELLWVVDLNRQSLDRVVPDIQIAKLQGMFAAAGWQVVVLKWGRMISRLFERPGGEALRARLEAMPNEEYQRMLRAAPAQTAERILADAPHLKPLLDDIDPAELAAAVRDLGGHDLGLLVDTFRGVDADRPTVVFAYTVKGRGLPTEGHPNNHSALLTAAQMDALAAASGMDRSAPWQPFDAGDAAGRLCARRREALRREPVTPTAPVTVPAQLGHPYRKAISTQAALGRLLADLPRDAPGAAARVVTCSPDVASSTNLGGWINKTGVWSAEDRRDWFADDAERVLRWQENSTGQHIELGIAEVNLVSLLGELGATWSRWGERLIPIATLYDPFVSRALEPWSYGIYAGGQSILVGTPSGVTLAPEGGAHQSITTPSIGLEQPGCVAWEPAFAQDLEWCFLHAMSRVGVDGGTSAYFRLSTRPLDPALARVPDDPALRERRRRQAVAGGYRISGSATDRVTLVGVGAIMPEVIAAAEALAGHGVDAGVICLTSPDLVFRSLQQRGSRDPGVGGDILEELLPAGRGTPLVTVQDGHPHTLAFLAAARGDRIRCLGVTEFGQSSSLADAYRLHGIDTSAIVDAALTLIS